MLYIVTETGLSTLIEHLPGHFASSLHRSKQVFPLFVTFFNLINEIVQGKVFFLKKLINLILTACVSCRDDWEINLHFLEAMQPCVEMQVGSALIKSIPERTH